MHIFASNEAYVFLFVVVGALLIAYMVWYFSRSRALLDKWAEDNGYEIVHSKFRHFLRGPFFWTSSKGQTVYYVRVRDQNGDERSGWVCCGGYWAGVFSNKTEVRWDDNG